MTKKIFILVALFAGLGLKAQDVSLTAEAPRVVRVGEQFRLSYTVNARPSSFVAPEITDFYVLSGPNQSTSTSLQIINGRRTSSYTITYTYYLQATGQGKFTVPPAKVIVENQEYTSNPVEIEVLGGEDSAGQPRTQQEGQAQAPEDVDLSDELHEIETGEDVPVKVEHLRNVWCHAILMKDEIGLIHIVETVRD